MAERKAATRELVARNWRASVEDKRVILNELCALTSWPPIKRGWVDAKLGRAFNNPDPVAGLRVAKHLAKLLEDKHLDAAASLRERLDRQSL